MLHFDWSSPTHEEDLLLRLFFEELPLSEDCDPRLPGPLEEYLLPPLPELSGKRDECFLSSFCLARLSSLSLRTRDSSTHSSQFLLHPL